MSNRFAKKEEKEAEKKPPLFRADIVLAIPSVVMRPSLEEIQTALNKAVQVMLKMSEHIPQWEHLANQQRQQQKVRVSLGGNCAVLTGLLWCSGVGPLN